MNHLRKFNEEILPRDKDGNPAEVIGSISELIKRKNKGEKLTDDEMYSLHLHFYKTNKEYKDKYNDMVDKLLKK